MKNLALTILLMFGVLMSVNGQHNRHALLADSLYKFSSYAKAVKHYEKAVQKDPDPALYVNLGNSYYKLQQYNSAVVAFQNADQVAQSWPMDARLNYLESQRILGNEKEVESLLEKWNEIPSGKEKVLEASLRGMDLYYIDSAIYHVDTVAFNSPYSDFSPSYFNDGIVFASSRNKGNTSNKKFHWNNENYLDLYIYAEESTKPYGDNTKFHDGPISFYNDGKNVIFTKNEKAKKKKDQKQLALFQADVDENGDWKNISALPFNNEDYSVSHPSISKDGQVLYFVSNRPDGLGGTDIYRAFRTGNGWSEPENLGGQVNTEGNEMFPLIYNTEFLFASDGHPGLGGLDIFVAEPLDDHSFLIRNPGYPINSTWDDFSLITKDGRDGYFSSNRAGHDDIYSFTKGKIVVEITYIDEQENVLDSVITTLHGKEILPKNKVTRLYLDRESLNDFETSREFFLDTTFQVKTNDEFFISKIIPLRKRKNIDRGIVNLYPIEVNDLSYDLFMNVDKSLVKADDNNHWRESYSLDKIPEMGSDDKIERITSELELNGYTVILHDPIQRIFFDFDKSDIRSSEHEKLNRVAELLKTYSQTNVSIGAHTDERGSDAYNMALSKRRAASTLDYLISRGIDSGRLKSIAYGESLLFIICNSCTEREHQQNRRVTFDITLED